MRSVEVPDRRPARFGVPFRITQASYVLPAGAFGALNAIAALPSGATASAPRSPIGTTLAPDCASTAANGSVEVERVAPQTPRPIAAAAATAAAAASGAVQLRLRGSETTFGRSARAWSRIRSFSATGGAGPGVA